MGSFSDYFVNKIINHVFYQDALLVPPTELSVALFLDDPTGIGPTEVPLPGTAYARQKSTTWTDVSSGFTTNSTLIQFPVATADWGTVNYFAIYDGLTGGNLIAYSSLAQSFTIATGDSISFSSGTISITLS